MKRLQVSQRALRARIDRLLKTEGRTLLACRKTDQMYDELGPFVIVRDGGLVERTGVDLITLARQTGTLRSFESVAK